MSIKDWPRHERPREKLLHQGESALSDAELLAILLQTGTKNKNVLELSRELLTQAGSLSNLFHLDFSCLPGLGVAKFTLLKASLELARRYFFENAKQTFTLKNTDDTKKFLLTQLNKRTQEIFACIFLNNKNKIIAYEELFFGSIDRAEIYPREIVKAIFKHNATSVIFAHNHTSGDPTPSLADIILTQHLKKLLKSMDIELLDHLVIGNQRVISINAHFS